MALRNVPHHPGQPLLTKSWRCLLDQTDQLRSQRFMHQEVCIAGSADQTFGVGRIAPSPRHRGVPVVDTLTVSRMRGWMNDLKHRDAGATFFHSDGHV